MNKAQIARAFLQNDVPGIIKDLKGDVMPAWGAMSALEMLEHLIITLKVSTGEIHIPSVTRPDQYDRIRNHLIGDEMIPKHVRFPISDEELSKWRIPDLENAKVKLEEEIHTYIAFVDQNPDFMANHPYAGPMCTEDLMGFHQKHFLHHFTQFGLV